MLPYIRTSLFVMRSFAVFMCMLGVALTYNALIKNNFNGQELSVIALVVVGFALLIVLSNLPGRLFRLFPDGVKTLDKALDTWLTSCSGEIETWMDAMPKARLGGAVCLAAGLTLFLELVLIRWEASFFPVFAFYKNFTLLACFCGLGIGYALSRQKHFLPACLPMLVMLMILLSVLRYAASSNDAFVLNVVPVWEETTVKFAIDRNLGLVDYMFMWAVPSLLLLTGTFLLNVLTMLPAGQFCGSLMRRMTPLASYGANLVGSIAGVLLLFVVSWLWAGPAIWFGVTALILAGFQLGSKQARQVALCCAAVCAMIASCPVDRLVQDIYSPYQLVQKTTNDNGLMRLHIAGHFYQMVDDLDPVRKNVKADKQLYATEGYYDLPFKSAGKLENVAIVGAGAGNDVAAALRYGAAHVDAVEIDPVIFELGRRNHPEHPYQNARVRRVLDDARNFFRTTTEQFDAIVYGALDSYIVVSQGANLRVDSYVYTEQGLQSAFDHLKPGGLLSVAFALPNDTTGEKVFKILQGLKDAGPPVAIRTGYSKHRTSTFMVSKAATVELPLEHIRAHDYENDTEHYVAGAVKVLDLPTDDWPFFYLNKKGFPPSYVFVLGLMLVMTVALLKILMPGQHWQRSYLPFFFLGAGFMLVETKAITELGLSFGNTWYVVGITIISVLIMAFLANLLAGKVDRRILLPAFAGLLATIVVGYLVATGYFAHEWLGKLGKVALLISPLFFSGLIFSTLIKEEPDVSGAMAYNLMGAMIGGMLEYNSMQFGFAALYLIGLALYGLAWLTMRRPSMPV